MNIKRTATAVMVMAVLSWPVVATGQAPDAQSRYMPTGPAPKLGYQPYDQAARAPGQVVIAGVPDYLWRHGCGPTAAGMVIGYWDGQGYGKLIPGSAAVQTAAVDQAIASGDSTYLNNCNFPDDPPLHFGDYSCPQDYYPTLLADRSELPAGDEHASDSLGDFMETSWSAAGNYYGWSWFSDVDDALVDYTAYANAAYGASYVPVSFSETWGNFTWEDFQNEINNGRPMVFLVDTTGDGYTDHFVTAIGWRDSNGYPEYGCFDTWSPAGIRWERFRALSPTYSWGVYGATYFRLSESIPAVPEWGLVAVTLLLLTAGKVVSARWHRPAA